MEWLRAILEGAEITDGTLNVETLQSAIQKEFPKHAVPKAQFNEVNEKLKAAGAVIIAKASMDELGMGKADYEWYLDLRRFGSAKHAGYGLGFERLIMYVTGIANIRDVLPFPRTTRNCDF